MLYGPLHNETAVKNFEQAVNDAKAQGGTIVYGGKVRGIVIAVCYTCIYNEKYFSDDHFIV